MGEFLILAFAIVTPVVALEVARRPGWPYWFTAGACVVFASLPWIVGGTGLAAVLSFGATPTTGGFVVLSIGALRARPFLGWLVGVGTVLLATLIATAVAVGLGHLTP